MNMKRMIWGLCLVGVWLGGTLRAEDEVDFRDLIPGIPESVVAPLPAASPASVRPPAQPELRAPVRRAAPSATTKRRRQPTRHAWPKPELPASPEAPVAPAAPTAPVMPERVKPRRAKPVPQALILLPNNVRPSRLAPRPEKPIVAPALPLPSVARTPLPYARSSARKVSPRRLRQELPMLSNMGGTSATPARKQKTQPLPLAVTLPRVTLPRTFTATPPRTVTPTTAKRVVESIPARGSPVSESPSPSRIAAALPWPRAVKSTLPEQSNTPPLFEAPAPTKTHPVTPMREEIQAMVGTTTKGGFNQVVARYNGMTFTRLDLYTVMERTYGRQALDRLLMPILLRNELSRMQLTIAKKDLAEALRIHLKRMTPAGETNVNPETLTQKWFKMSVAQYQKVVVWPEVAIQQLVLHDLNVTDDDVLNHYYTHQKKYMQPEQVKIAHILISPVEYLPPSMRKHPQRRLAVKQRHWQKAHAEAVRVHEKLRSGYDFKTLVKEASQDPKTKNKAGVLGTFSRGKLLKEVEDAAFSLVPGQYSELVKTMYGYHIIYLLDKKPQRSVSFSKIKPIVRAEYIDSLTQTYAMRLLTRLKMQAVQRQELIISDQMLIGGK